MSAVMLFNFALVGGGFTESLLAGLWCWSCWSVSTGTNINIGARLLIYREMMCMSAVILPTILSAVLILPILSVLACGVGL